MSKLKWNWPFATAKPGTKIITNTGSCKCGVVKHFKCIWRNSNTRFQKAVLSKEQSFRWYQSLFSILSRKHKNMKNSHFSSEHFRMKFFLEACIMAWPTFCLANDESNKAWAQLVLSPEQSFYALSLRKSCRVRPRLCWRGLMSNLWKHPSSRNKTRPESFCYRIKEIRKVWLLPVVLAFQILLNPPCSIFFK